MCLYIQDTYTYILAHTLQQNIKLNVEIPFLNCSLCLRVCLFGGNIYCTTPKHADSAVIILLFCALILTLILSLLSDASVKNKIGISNSFFCLFAHSFCVCVCVRVIYSSIQCRCLRDTIIYKKIKRFKNLLMSQ